MSLTHNEAKALLTQLADLKVSEVLDNTDLVNALICLKQMVKVKPISDGDIVDVYIVLNVDDKISAIKAYRILTDCGLKEAKDWIDFQWPSGGSSLEAGIEVGSMTRVEFNKRRDMILRDDWLASRVSVMCEEDQ